MTRVLLVALMLGCTTGSVVFAQGTAPRASELQEIPFGAAAGQSIPALELPPGVSDPHGLIIPDIENSWSNSGSNEELVERYLGTLSESNPPTGSFHRANGASEEVAPTEGDEAAALEPSMVVALWQQVRQWGAVEHPWMVGLAAVGSLLLFGGAILVYRARRRRTTSHALLLVHLAPDAKSGTTVAARPARRAA